MKCIWRTACALAAVLALANCGKTQFVADKLADILSVDEPDHGVKKIEYYSGGGYPGPNGPIFSSLVAERLASGRVQVRFESQSCAVSAYIEAEIFDELASAIVETPVVTGAGAGGADMGSTTLILTYVRPALMDGVPVHLYEDETSRSRPVLARGNPAVPLVRDLLDKIRLRCPSS
jgi:hypothetical protein